MPLNSYLIRIWRASFLNKYAKLYIVQSYFESASSTCTTIYDYNRVSYDVEYTQITEKYNQQVPISIKYILWSTLLFIPEPLIATLARYEGVPSRCGSSTSRQDMYRLVQCFRLVKLLLLSKRIRQRIHGIFFEDYCRADTAGSEAKRSREQLYRACL